MSRDRWSISNALRQVRGARTAAADRAAVRYRRLELAAAAIRRAVKALNQAEAALLDARTRVVAARVAKRRAA